MIDKFLTEEQKSLFPKLGKGAKREVMREVFKKNFEALVYLLGYRDTGKFHIPQMEKISDCRILEDVPKRRLWLWSRGHFKTSLITEAHTVFLILNNPNIRVLIVANTLDIAKKVLINIKSHFMFNDDFRYFFPEFCPKPSKEGKIEFGTTEYFTVPSRTRALKEPTCMCAGVGTNLTGLHFDYMKIDDLVTKDSVSNETQIIASKDYYSSLRQLFDNPTIPREDVIGTPYHFNDLYGELRVHKEFEKSFVKAATDMTFSERAFPERFSRKGLEDILNDPNIGPYQFSSQYMLNPINPADAKFREEWWKEYDKAPEGLAEYICCDPASTQKKKSDYTVIQRWGVDKDGNHYLLEGVRDKMNVFHRIDTIVEMAKRSPNLKGVKYEALGGRHGDLEQLKLRFIKERLHLEPEETKSTAAAKVDRIEQRLVGQWHAGIISLPHTLPFRSYYDGKTYDFVKEYKLEFLQFPFSLHDDILDCHSQMFDGGYIAKGKAKIKEKPKEDEFEWWRKKTMKNLKPDRKRYVFGNRRGRFQIPATKSYR